MYLSSLTSVYKGDTGVTGDTGVRGDTGVGLQGDTGISGEGADLQNIGYYTMDTGVSQPAYAEGRVYWDTDNHCLAVMTSPTTTTQVGQETVAMCFNNSGVNILDGHVVRMTGAHGDRPSIVLALATGEESSYALGVATQNINNQTEGLVTIRGVVKGFDTLVFAEGDILYLSSVDAGHITNVKPTAPNHTVILGRALNSKSNGSIYVNVSVGHEVEELHNVLITDINNGEVLTWETSTSLWKNKPVSTIKGDTGVQGLKGDTGVKGDTGSGLQGDTGTRGDTGTAVFDPSVPVDTKTADYTITTNDSTILVDASGANRVITLPTAASSDGYTFEIKKMDSSANTVTIDGNGTETIDGELTIVLILQYENLTVRSTGSGWVIL